MNPAKQRLRQHLTAKPRPHWQEWPPKRRRQAKASTPPLTQLRLALRLQAGLLRVVLTREGEPRVKVFLTSQGTCCPL
jgi:hypothetical protein